jgi:hypothetical protein
VLEPEPAAVREESLIQREQLVVSTVDVRTAGGLADVGVGLKCRRGGFGVAGSEGAPLFADDVGLAQAGVRLEQRRAVVVLAGQRPHAPVDPKLDDAPVVRAISRDRHRHLDATSVAVERHHGLLDPAPGGGDPFHRTEHSVSLA